MPAGTAGDSFIFGDEANQIPLEYLRFCSGTKSILISPGKVKAALDIMLQRIIDKTPWLGTPEADKLDELFTFYSTMLANFEEIITFLADKDPKTQAGMLISIAKVQLEGRCAAGYQSEIAQARMLLDSNEETSGFEGSFNKLANLNLMSCVEEVVRKQRGGDSHDYNQMLFSVGIAFSQDPLSHLSIDSCQNMILDSWKKQANGKFKESLKQIDYDTLYNWFYEETTNDFQEDVLIKQKECNLLEFKIIEESRNRLQNKKLEDGLIEKVLNIFQTAQGASLQCSLIKRQVLPESIYQILVGAITPEDIDKAEKLFKEMSEKDKSRRVEIQSIVTELNAQKQPIPIEITKERSELQHKLMGVQREFNTLKSYGESRVKLSKLLNRKLLEKDLLAIFEEKKLFSAAMNQLAEDQEISFIAIETGLPSKTLQHLRKQAYAAQFFNEKNEINDGGVANILLKLGVFEM